MCRKTTTTKRRSATKPLPTLTEDERRRVRTDAIDAALVAGLYSILVEMMGAHSPAGFERLEPLRAAGLHGCYEAKCLTYGQHLRYLADLADRSDVAWSGGHGIEDEHGNEIPPKLLYPCLAVQN